MLATRTFLFADLRDYTRFVEQHGDAAAATLIADYRRIVRAELARHEGGEVKTEGDSFYVVFSTTGSAVSCGAAILREAEHYSRDHPDRQMRIGIGIHAGEPVPHEGQYVGTAVIVAARLAQAAGAGELFVTEVVRALLPRSVVLPMAERTGLSLKGLDAPPRVFSVDWRTTRAPAAASEAHLAGTAIAAAPPASRQVLCPVIIGREREFATLEDQLREAVAGRGQTVLVSGEAGLGKSALLDHFIERARASGARLLAGECSEIEARRPFGPFIDALVSGDLALPPELARGGPGALPAVEVERYRVHVAFAERLAEAARERPVVVVIEDLHWADEATQELVPYLARKLRDARVLLLLTYRSDELHRLHPLNQVLAELGRGRLAEEVRLKRLTLAETGGVIRAALALTQPPTTEFCQALFERTEGNPFFIEEILRALVEQGELEYRDGAWHRSKAVADLAIPNSVRAAVQQRLLGLEPRARAAMQVAAVMGQRFDFEVLGAVSGLDERALLEAIKAAIEAQLVREEANAEGSETYAFRHALSREAVLAELLQRERRMLHRSVGEAIERIAAAGAAERAEELAYHFDEARDVARAHRYHSLAAERSLQMASPAGAIRHFERAIELAPEDDPALATLLLRLSDVSELLADHARALRAAQEARGLAQARGDRLTTGEAIYRIAECHWFLGATGQAAETAREGVALLEPLGPSGPLAGCYARLALLAMIDHRYAEAIELSQRAIAMARDVGARQVEIAAMIILGSSMGYNEDRVEEGMTLLRTAFALADEHGFVLEAEHALNNMLSLLSASDAPLIERRSLQSEATAYSRRHGHRTDPERNREAGWAVGDADWDKALAITAETGNEGVWGAARELIAATIMVFREGPLPAHLARGDAAHRRLVAAGSYQWLSMATGATRLEYAAERWTAVLERARPALDLISGTSGPAVSTATMAVRAARQLGDRDAERRWLEALARRGTTPTQRAGAGYARAALARSDTGDALAAVDLLREALALIQDRGALSIETPLRQELVEVLVAAGRAGEAAAVLLPLQRFYRKAKAVWYLARLEAWAHSIGVPLAAE